MKHIYLVFLLYFVGFTQINIRVLSIGDRFQVDSIEHEIILNTIRLHNSNETEQVSFVIDTLDSFNSVLERLKNFSPEERDVLLGTASITRTNARKKIYDFSSVYIPAKEVITTFNKILNFTSDSLNDRRLGYQAQSIEDISAKRLRKLVSFQPVGFLHYAEKINALVTGQIDFAIDDNISIWDNPELSIVYDLKVQNGDGIAIAFPKNSKLRSRLDKYLNYYLNSARFYRLITAKYGLHIARYFKRELRILNDDF